MTRKRTIRIGNAQAFWGDDGTAPRRLLEQVPGIDFLTLDYLAEVSMAVLHKQRRQNRGNGFPADFPAMLESLLPWLKQETRPRIVTNAGGLDPRACAEACAERLAAISCGGVKIGIVTGDDVLPVIQGDPENPLYQHLELADVDASAIPEGLDGLGNPGERLTTANAYLGASGIAEALERGAEIVITGRVADPSLVVGPCVYSFGWKPDNYAALAGATVAGHLIECGTQVTGGISTDWLDLPDVQNIGFPVVQIATDGSCVITKGPDTGGRVDRLTVTEQLLYEIGDPDAYLSPDCTVSFTSLKVTEVGPDAVRVSGAVGRPPPRTLKVSGTFAHADRAEGALVITGRDAPLKARRAGNCVLDRVESLVSRPQRSLVEVIGNGRFEVMLRIVVADENPMVLKAFSRLFMSLVTAGPQGTSGYAQGRPKPHETFGFWPCLIERTDVLPKVEIIEA